jgi:hypothetical protein
MAESNTPRQQFPTLDRLADSLVAVARREEAPGRWQRWRARMRRRRNTAAVVLAALLVSGSALAAVVQLVERAEPPNPDVVDETPPPAPVEPLDPAVRDLASVFGRPRTEADEVRVQPVVQRGLTRRFGAQFGNSRRVPGDAPGLRAAWLVPAQGHICALPEPDEPDVTGALGSCFSLTLIEEGDGVLTLERPDDVVVVGVAPDGARRAELELADGTEARAPVRDNSFVARLPAAPVAVRFAGAAGRSP